MKILIGMMCFILIICCLALFYTKFKKREAGFFLVYTTSYVFFITIILYFYWKMDKSMIYTGDAYISGLPGLAKGISLYKNIIKSLILDHKLEIPLIDFNIGFGMDTIVNASRLPLALTGLFVPQKHFVLYYEFFIILRMYCQGIIFSRYCFYIKIQDKLGVLMGSLTYVFCGYSLYAFTRYMGFFSFLIYLPLCLLGIEKYLREKKINLFIGSVAFLFFGDWYTGYVVTLLVMVYSFMRLFPYILNRKMITFLQKGLCLAGMCLLGIALSAFVLLPCIYAFLNSCRVSGISVQSTPLYYSRNYYISLLTGFFSAYQNIGYDMFLGFLPISLICIVVLFLKCRNRAVFLKAALIICLCFAGIPIFGKIFNGGGYVTNRWSFGLAFTIAVITAYTFPVLVQLSSKEKKILSGIVFFLSLFFVVYSIREKNVVLLIVTCLIISQLMAVGMRSVWILFGTATWSVIVMIIIVFSPLVDTYIESFKNNNVQTELDQSYMSAASGISDDSLYRIGTPWNETDLSMYYNFNGVSIYNSILDEKISSFFDSLSMNTERYRFQLAGLDGRSVLNDLFAVKYYVMPKGAGGLVPYNYTLSSEGEYGDIYKSKFEQEPVQKHTGYILKSDYDKLSQLERQELLLQGIVTTREMKALKKIQYKNSYLKIPYTIFSCEGVEIDKNIIKVVEPNGTIELKFDECANSEIYMLLKGLKVRNGEQINVCYVNSASCSTRFVAIREDMKYYFDDDFTVNLGYSENGISGCTIRFPSIGEYSYDEIELMAYPMEKYELFRNQRAASDYLKECSYETNTLRCAVNLKEKSLLQFSLPYSNGWSAYMDGKEVEIQNTDLMFMSVLADEGKHEIVLVYRTPYLRLGLIVTACAAVLLIAVNYILHYRRKRTDLGESNESSHISGRLWHPHQ